MSAKMKNILLAKYSAKKLEAYSYSYVYNWVLLSTRISFSKRTASQKEVPGSLVKRIASQKSSEKSRKKGKVASRSSHKVMCQGYQFDRSLRQKAYKI